MYQIKLGVENKEASCTLSIGEIKSKDGNEHIKPNALFMRKLQSRLKEVVCRKQFESILKSISKMIPQFPYEKHIVDGIFLDLSVQKTLVTDLFITIDYRGQFLNKMSTPLTFLSMEERETKNDMPLK